MRIKLTSLIEDLRAIGLGPVAEAKNTSYLGTDGKPLAAGDLAWIKKCAAEMELSWQMIAARPKDSAVLLKAKKEGKSVEAACDLYGQHKAPR